jgi:hypothetical protein
VMALPDPVKENDIVLQVWGSVTEADVRAWCDVQLSAYKQPTDVRVFSSGVTA